MTVLDIQSRTNSFIVTQVASKAMLSYAKQIFKYAVASEHIACEKNYLELARLVKAKKSKKREYRYYTEHQAKLVEQGLHEYFNKKPRYLISFTLLLRTGIRTGELLGLQWDNIDFENQRATLNG